MIVKGNILVYLIYFIFKTIKIKIKNKKIKKKKKKKKKN